MACPLGWLRLAVSEHGVCRASLQPEEPRPLALDAEAAALAAEARRQLREYLTGTRHAFDLMLDLSVGSAFQQATWRATCAVPFGVHVAYGNIAAQLGRPQAARAVGQALKRNPLLILVPCHRVVRMHGGLGGFRAGEEVKVWLLKHEGAILF